MLVDVDALRRLNDVHGTTTGDVVLRAVTQFLTAGLRDIDAISRFDGDSFALTLPKADLNHAVQVAERVRNAIGNSCQPRVGRQRRSTSRSAAAWPKPGRMTMPTCCTCGRAWRCKPPRRPGETAPFITRGPAASRSRRWGKKSNWPWRWPEAGLQNPSAGPHATCKLLGGPRHTALTIRAV